MSKQSKRNSTNKRVWYGNSNLIIQDSAKTDETENIFILFVYSFVMLFIDKAIRSR